MVDFVSDAFGDDEEDAPGPPPGAPAVRPAGPDDLDDVVTTLTMAFHADPVMRWAFPQPDVRSQRLAALWGFFAATAYLPAGACTLAPGAAATLWLPPPGRLTEAFWEEHGGDFVVALEGDVDRLSVFGEAVREHHPEEPHHYLLAIGVRPHGQGRGLGGDLLRHTLATADARRERCHLEATSESSMRLYRRHGFAVHHVLHLPDGPPVWVMQRAPRPDPFAP